jgi:hypothetical protein
MKFSIIILTFNRFEALRRTMESVAHGETGLSEKILNAGCQSRVRAWAC